MKSAYYTETGTARDVLINGELETPKPSANEVLISVKASGINPSDVKRRAGWQNKNLPFPLIIPHSDGAGQIVQVGSNLSTDLIGNSVWIWNAQGG
jgi:NADPH2:quinone reductase